MSRTMSKSEDALAQLARIVLEETKSKKKKRKPKKVECALPPFVTMWHSTT
jgi:hypothetical protein